VFKPQYHKKREGDSFLAYQIDLRYVNNYTKYWKECGEIGTGVSGWYMTFFFFFLAVLRFELGVCSAGVLPLEVYHSFAK
jgi:hypothetical protein